MPANATSHRPAIAVSFADSPRRDTQQQPQGEAFRSALDSIEKSDPSAKSRSREHERRETDEAKPARRDRKASRARDEGSKAARAEDAERYEQAQAQAQAQVQAEQGAGSAEKNEVHEMTESSGGGFGSDPPVAEFSEAGGSVRTTGTATAGASGSIPAGGATAAAAVVSTGAEQKTAAAGLNPATGLLGQRGDSDALQGLRQSGNLGEGEARASMAGALAQEEGNGGTGNGNAAGAQGEGNPNAEDAHNLASLDKLNAELPKSPGESEFKLNKVAGDRLTQAGQNAENPGNQAQATASKAATGGSRGLGGTVHRAGLEGAGQSSATPNLYDDAEPLPGSVKLRGVRGARLTVPTADGQTIRARVDLTEERVDVRLTAPDGSSQLAERRSSELREALANHGMELGEFDVSTSEDNRAETARDGGGGSQSREDDSSNGPTAAVDPWGRPIGVETSRGSAADGRGALLDLRL